MDNKIEIFKNEQFGEVRTILEGEKVLFCAADVAKALGYTNPNKAVNDHCRAITKRSTPISGKVQSINFIPEGDVYRLIIRSKLPAAEKFELWVFDEVIPTIRKTGGYMTDSLLERIQKEPAVIVEFAQALILEKNRVKALECELITAKPKADYYNIAAKCDKETMLQREYTPDCMDKRNRYMVDHADYILAVWNGCPSGTGNTVRYAHKKGRSIIVINPVSLDVTRE